MKKILILALAAMATITVACKKETTTEVYKVDTLEAEGLSPISIIVKGEMSPDLWRSKTKVRIGFFWGKDPANLTDFVEGENQAKGVFTATLTDLYPNAPIWFRAYCSILNMDFYGELKSFTTSSFDEVVDLGLSVKWRAWNLGASSPEELGDYYAWGELDPHYRSLNPLIWRTDKSTGYSIESYSLCNGGYRSYTRYCTSSEYGAVDFRTMLGTGPTGDDIASILLGGNWRMPTNKEIDELIENCSIETFHVGEIYGARLSSNKPGFTDKWIFFPDSGFMADLDYYPGSVGIYWSSEVDTEEPAKAFCLRTDSPNKERKSYFRDWGCSIRPVLADAPPVAVTGVSIDQASLKLKVGQTVRLNATVSPPNATDHTVIWTSSEPQTASVDKHGNVTAKSPGTASIYAGSGGVNTEKCEVEVTE